VRSRILKIELFTLFLSTIISFVYYYYQDHLPDNLFLISSRTPELSILSYYTTSLVALIGHYTGPWIFFPFICFAILSASIFYQREHFLDVASVIFMVLLFLLLFYFFFPLLLGKGVYQILKSSFYDLYLVGATLLSAGIFLGITFRSSVGLVAKRGVIICWQTFRSIATLEFTSWIRGRTNFLTERLSSKYGRIKLQAVGSLSGIGGKKNQNKMVKAEIPLIAERATPVESDMDNSSDEIVIEEQQQETVATDTATVNLRPTDSNTLQKRHAPLTAEELQRQEHSYQKMVNAMVTTKSERKVHQPESGYFANIMERIEIKLEQFRIDAQIINILKGPVVDTFELELGAGVKVSKVNAITEDLSLALYGAPIRMVYPMHGKTTLGIEIPRSPREVIYLDELLSSEQYSNSELRLPVALGKNAFGEPVVVDLTRMPHMLVAGSTGSGKSVFINTMLISLLIKRSPRQLRLILIDPKQLELVLYSKLPHLALPVITDAKSASIALLWVCQEMERRYSILKEFGVRNLEGFNLKLERGEGTPEQVAAIHPHYDDVRDSGYHLPELVVVVDEFADLILTKAGREIENSVCRLAGKARAAGIHLVVATQRPSVDVITGLIKSNFPTRISFRVTTAVDSRTILGTMGAEKLLGKGDMLYKHGVETTRLHSAYVDEVEIEELTTKLAVLDGSFDDAALDFLESGGSEEGQDPYAFGSHITTQGGVGGEGKDPLYDQAVEMVVEFRTASASMLQRRMKVGYNRAANLVELMEAQGVVGPAEGSKPRKVLI
jgi:DNA segregation ATPase FtsK/SpoIIIE, S-DNA-T family